MLGGIALQMAAITIYVALASEFLWRFFTDRPLRAATPTHHVADDTLATNGPSSPEKLAVSRHVLPRRLKLMIGALVFATLVIFIRTVYRTCELANGWTGRIIRTQVYFSQWTVSPTSWYEFD
jgi:hypothetical protein